MRRILLLLCLLGAPLPAFGEDEGDSSSTSSSSAVAPGVAGVASVIPGLGQAISGRPGEGLAWFVTVAGGLAFSPRGQDWPATAFLDLWMYNIYDAYRDAGARRSAKYSLLENYVAAFNPVNLFDPIGAPVIAFSLVGGRPGPNALASSKTMAPFEMAFIALGEEGLFRGFFFPGFSDLFHSAAVGAVFSSALFAYAHKFYRGQSKYALESGVFTGRMILGLLMCIQTYAHKYDLRRSIFAHTWFDVVYEYRRGGGTIGGEGPRELPQPSGMIYKYVVDF